MRPQKARDNNDDDDAPVYVDEESNEVITKEEYRALVGGTANQTEDGTKDQPTEKEDKTEPPKEPTAKQSNLTEVGGQKKRKQARVVGEDKPGAEEAKPESEGKPKASASASRKPKKAKKIKLSFDEE